MSGLGGIADVPCGGEMGLLTVFEALIWFEGREQLSWWPFRQLMLSEIQSCQVWLLFGAHCRFNSDSQFMVAMSVGTFAGCCEGWKFLARHRLR